MGDACDNCRGFANPGQEDADNDGVGDACVDGHDLALVDLFARQRVTILTRGIERGRGLRGPGTRLVIVTVLNNGTVPEVVEPDVLADLVTLKVESLNPASECEAPSPSLQPVPRMVTIAPGKTLSVAFVVNFRCATDPGFGEGFEDFRLIAQVHHDELDDGAVDRNPGNDARRILIDFEARED